MCSEVINSRVFSGKSQVRFPRVRFLGWDFHCDFPEEYSRLFDSCFFSENPGAKEEITTETSASLESPAKLLGGGKKFVYGIEWACIVMDI